MVPAIIPLIALYPSAIPPTNLSKRSIYPQTQQRGGLTLGEKICFYNFWPMPIFPLGLAKDYWRSIIEKDWRTIIQKWEGHIFHVSWVNTWEECLEEEQSGQKGSKRNQTTVLLIYTLCLGYFCFFNPSLALWLPGLARTPVHQWAFSACLEEKRESSVLTLPGRIGSACETRGWPEVSDHDGELGHVPQDTRPSRAGRGLQPGHLGHSHTTCLSQQ